MAKVTLVPCSVNLTGERDTVGHGKVTINNARIIGKCMYTIDVLISPRKRPVLNGYMIICIYISFDDST